MIMRACWEDGESNHLKQLSRIIYSHIWRGFVLAFSWEFLHEILKSQLHLLVVQQHGNLTQINYTQDFEVSLDDDLRIKTDTLIIPDGIEKDNLQQAF